MSALNTDLWFADTDSRRVEASVVTGFEAAARMAGQTDFTLYDGDPRRLFLQAVALLIIQQNALIDLTGKSNLLRFADESTIEDIGWLYGPRADRLQPSRAMTTIEFSLSAVRAQTTTITAGTRVATENLTFSTAVHLEIPAGKLFGSVQARCETVGTAGNGMLPGQVFQIVDHSPFVAHAINITESAGGADLEDLEAYRNRVRHTPESFSTAGPDGAYWFWAMTANAGIIDVDVWMPELDLGKFGDFLRPWGINDPAGFYEALFTYFRESGTGPGNVNVAPLMEGGKLPTKDILDAVHEICNGRSIRPLTDFLHVMPPEPVLFDIDFTYWIDGSEITRTNEIQAAVNSAAQEYISWQSGRIGRWLKPDRLTQLVKNAGARRLDIRSPVDTEIFKGQVAQLNEFNIIYGGIERDSRRGRINA